MGAKTEVKVRSLFLSLFFCVCVLVTPFFFFRDFRVCFLILLANDDGDERGMGLAISRRCEEEAG